MEYPGAPVRSTAVKSVTFDQRQIISKSYAQQTAPSGPAPDTSINVSFHDTRDSSATSLNCTPLLHLRVVCNKEHLLLILTKPCGSSV